jgi:hypothetical protein
MTPEQLTALHASVERASCLSARHDWERKATAHAELFTMLGDVTGDRGLGGGAPPQGPALHGAPGLRSRFQQH